MVISTLKKTVCYIQILKSSLTPVPSKKKKKVRMRYFRIKLDNYKKIDVSRNRTLQTVVVSLLADVKQWLGKNLT